MQTIEHLRYYAGWADKIYGEAQDTLGSVRQCWLAWQGWSTV